MYRVYVSILEKLVLARKPMANNNMGGDNSWPMFIFKKHEFSGILSSGICHTLLMIEWACSVTILPRMTSRFEHFIQLQVVGIDVGVLAACLSCFFSKLIVLSKYPDHTVQFLACKETALPRRQKKISEIGEGFPSAIQQPNSSIVRRQVRCSKTYCPAEPIFFLC